MKMVGLKEKSKSPNMSVDRLTGSLLMVGTAAVARQGRMKSLVPPTASNRRLASDLPTSGEAKTTRNDALAPGCRTQRYTYAHRQHASHEHHTQARRWLYGGRSHVDPMYERSGPARSCVLW